MPPILLAHAQGEDAQVEAVADALRSAGYNVVYEGTVLVGESLVQEASAALAAGSPVVLCGTVTAMGTGWAHQVVNAARTYPDMRVFGLQMEQLAYLQPLTLDSRVAKYWQDPGKAIADLLEALREFYPQQAVHKKTDGDDVLLRYCDLALRTNDIVDLANLPVTDRNLAAKELLLRSLYVGLRVSVEPTSALADGPLRTRAAASLPPGSEEFPDRTRRWPVGELLDRSRRLVLLGDPGAGKSTLLRWLATAYLLRLTAHPDWMELPDIGKLPDEDWLPILVRCRDLEDSQSSASLDQVLDHHLRKLGIAGHDIKELNDLLRSRLEAGTAILLVDGLDEITAPAGRTKFCRQIEQIHITVPRAPVIATSRIVGYREMGLRIGRGFEHATVLDLTSEDKDEFVRKWCTLTEPMARRDDAEAELIKDIHSTDRIERLTGNPMLLTTMALVKKKVGKLPSRRADLYREAVDVLLNWRSDVDEILDPREALPQLEYLGYAMCAAGVQRLRADEIISLLAKMRREFSSVRAVRRHEPDEFLSLLERRTGIIVEIGKIRHKGQLVPAYEFRHLTFQEYLAGLALVEGRFPGRDRSRSLADNISPLGAQTSAIQENVAGDDDLAVSDNWREALRLCVMSCNDDDVDGALLAIATVRDDEDVKVTARPRAVLAMSCLADEPNVSEQVGLDLIDSFTRVLRESDSGPGGTTAALAINEVASSLWAPVLIRRLVVAWLSAADDRIWLAECAFDAMMQLIPADRDALRRYLAEHTRNLSDSDRVDRIRAALMIMATAQVSRFTEGPKLAMVPGLGSKLMGMLKQPGREAEAAAWAISMLTGQILHIGDAIWTLSARQITALIAHLKNEKTTGWAAYFLASSLCADYSDDHTLAEAISSRLAISDAPLAEALGSAYRHLFPAYADPIIPLTTHSSAAVQAAAASTLGRLGDRRAVSPLIELLSRSDDHVRGSVARALGQLGDPRALDPLLELLSAPTSRTRRIAAEALGRLGDPRALDPLLELLSAPEPHVRDIAAEALGELGDPRAVEPLIKLLLADDDQLRETAAFALGQIRDPRAVEPLIHLLAGHDETRDTAAMALGRLGDPRAVGPLLAVRKSTQSDISLILSAALATLGYDQALLEIQDLIRGSSADGRQSACWALATCEHIEQIRVLLSRDADGLSPGIDPGAEITDDDVYRYAVATRQTPDQVRRAYEHLQEKYLLRLVWRSRQ